MASEVSDSSFATDDRGHLLLIKIMKKRLTKNKNLRDEVNAVVIFFLYDIRLQQVEN